MNIPITQSKAWGKLQDDLGEKSILITEKNYHVLAIIKHIPTGNYLYCPYGPCYDDRAGFRGALDSLEKLAREEHAIFIRIEPQDPKFPDYAPKNAKKSQDLNPKETWLLDLAGTDDELNAKLPSRLLRYYRGAAKKGITITKSHNPNDIHYLLDLQRALAKEKGISTFSEHYLGTELKQPFATLYLVRYSATSTGDAAWGSPTPARVGEHAAAGPVEGKTADPIEGEVVATGLIFDDGVIRYNLQGAQSDEGRKLHATGILTIQLILDAKAKGLKIFDFWGIAPEGAPDTHPWAGFTNFKKTFAGYEQDYAGTYDLVLSPAKYKLYRAMRKVRRMV